MVTRGDIGWTTRLFHSSDIGELMAEPPVAGAARRQASGGPTADAPGAAGPAQSPHDPADRRGAVGRRLAA